MAKIIVGAAVGALLVVLLFAVSDTMRDREVLPDLFSVIRDAAPTNGSSFDTNDGRSQDDRPEEFIGSDSSNPATMNAESGTAPQNGVRLQADQSSSSRTLPETDAEREDRLVQELEQSRDAAALAGDALADLRIERMLEENPVVSPTPLPPEFDWVAEQRYTNMFHERFQRESIDGAWSARVEADFARFIYERPQIIERYGPPSIRCHSRSCEVFFSTTTRGNLNAQSDVRSLYDDFQDEMPGVFDCEQMVCIATANRANGQTTIFWGMRRGVAQPQGLVAGTEG